MNDESPAPRILAVHGLTTTFPAANGRFAAVDDVSFELAHGETLAIVGESGSGKSVACLSVLQLVDPPGTVAGSLWFRRRSGETLDLARASERTLRAIRGDEIAMVFQEPMTSLNPIHTVGGQIAETLRLHRGLGRRDAREAAVDMLARVGIADPRRRAAQYPHEHSGGMRQRAMIAMALACGPSLLVADEATSALDVTIQAQILDLLRAVRGEEGAMAMLFVTHDMGVVAEIADRVAVMYAGRIVEDGPLRAVLRTPRHPYTRALLQAMPPFRLRASGRQRLPTPIPGSAAGPRDRLAGCAFHPRCVHARDACIAAVPDLETAAPGHRVRCIRWREVAT